MLPKKTEWSILAQGDYFSVEMYVRTPDRPAMATIEPMRESIFLRKISRDILCKETYQVLCQSYQNLQPLFSIVHDNCGGYRLLYNGRAVVSPQYVFKRNPVGFVAPIPDGVVTEFSVIRSARTGQQLLLLGLIRFVNSDCEPNCEFDFASDCGIVQLRVKKRINPGDEIFAKYGPKFFEINACLCRTCRLQK